MADQEPVVQKEATGLEPLGIKIPDLKDVLTAELAENAVWVVANIETTSFWTVTPQRLTYRGEELWIIPIGKS